MSDGVDIRDGGAIAVDTETLRRVADGYARFATKIDEVLADLDAERARLLGVELGPDAAWRIDSVVRAAGWLVDAAAGLAEKLGSAATVYEIVELTAQRQAAVAAGDLDAVRALDGRLGAIVAEHPLLFVRAQAVQTMWWLTGPLELMHQAGASPLDAFGASAMAVFAAAVAFGGRGRVARGAPLSGPAPMVLLRGGTPAPARAPASLAGVVDRMPKEPAQVRVERYAMGDGTRRFAVYVAGTRALVGGGQPWNMPANVDLYTSRRSASYEATVQALQRAGARPGDTVYAFGHSQGAMIASRLAAQEGYDTRALVTFGSPVSADVGAQTLSVQVRHIDDPVVALADGGHPQIVGSDGSFVAERVADPGAGVQDLVLAAHSLDAYRDTAAMVDASTDPRAAAVDAVFRDLGGAEEVEAFEFEAVEPG